MTWARARIKTVRGTVASSWRLRDDSLSVDVEIPVNSRATIRIPMMGWPNVTVCERGAVLFRNGEIAGTVTGVLDASENAEHVELRVGAGSYSFLLNGQ